MKNFKFFISRFVKLEVVALLLLLPFMHSCYKDRFDVDKIAGGTWDPTLAAPVISSSLTMDKVTKNDSDRWLEYPDGLLGLIYQDTLYSSTGAQIVQFPDQQADTNFLLRLPPGMASGDSTSKYFQVSNNILVASGERLDSMLIKEGKLEVSITTNLNQDGRFEIIIPQLAKFGVDFRGIIPFTYSGGASTTVNATFLLNTSMLKLLQTPNGQSLTQYIKAVVLKGNNSSNMTYNVHMTEAIKNVTYYQAFGYFHQHTFSYDENTLGLNIFETSKLGALILEDPRLRLKVINSYGFPMEMTFDKLLVEKDGIQYPVISSLLPTIGINYPDYQHIHTASDTTFEFDKNNSNIVDIFNHNPNKLIVKAGIKSNPLGLIIPNFVLDTSEVNILMEVELPLHGRAMQFEIVDTSNFSITDIAEIQSIDFYINAYNMFPAEAKLQIYLADSNNNLVDSLFLPNNSVVDAATPGIPPSYRTLGKAHKLSVITFSGTQMRKLGNVKHMIFKASVSTKDAGTKIVKIYSDYSIDFKVAIKTKLKVDF